MTALLILVFGVPTLTAVGTDLLYAAVTKATGARVHAGKGNVDWPIVGQLAIGSIPATVLTIWLLSQSPAQSPVLARSITLALGAALLIAAFGLLFRERLQRFAIQPVDTQHPASHRPVLTVALGLLLGVLVSLTSVGAGALGIVMLRYLRPDIPSVRLVGSDIAHAVPLTCSLAPGIGCWATSTGSYLGHYFSDQFQGSCWRAILRIIYPSGYCSQSWASCCWRLD